MTYSRADLTAAAGVDPWALHAQVAGGDPGEIEALAARFYRAAHHAADAATAEAKSRRYVEHGYTVGGQPVSADPDGYARTAARAGREHLPAIAKILVSVGDDLALTQRGSIAQLTALDAELAQVDAAQRSFTNQVGHRLPRDEQRTFAASYVQRAVEHVRTRGTAIIALVDGYETTLATASRSLSALGYVAGEQVDFAAPPAVPSKSSKPTAVAAWWSALTPHERQTLLRTDYAALGSLQGLPATVLDLANRHVLHDYATHLTAEIAAAGVATVGLAALITRLARCRQIERTLSTPGAGARYLLRFDPGAPMGTTGAAVAIGDPDHARNTTVFVPGTTHSAADLSELAPTGQDLYDQMAGSSKSVIVWVDGPIPEHIVPGAAMDTDATRSGPRLSADLAGLRAAHVAASGHAGHVTAIGHSYGSTLLGRALIDGGHRYVDDAVFVGSPGVGVNHARDLGMDPHHVWSGQAGDDPILVVKNRFTPGMNGLNPEEGGFGARHFDVTGSHHHGQYFQGRSLANMAHIADGAYGSVHTVAAPDYRGPRELLTDGLDGTVLDPVNTDRAVLGDVFGGDFGDIDDDYRHGVSTQLHDLEHTGQDVLSSAGDLLGGGGSHTIALAPGARVLLDRPR